MAGPSTPFETDGPDWTDLDVEASFLESLTASGKVAVSTIGMSPSGRPVRAVLVADSPIWEQVDRCVMIIASAHGNEVAPREAAMAVIRDLAYSEDPDVVQMLIDIPIVFVPTVNPDGVAAQSRHNGANIDLNRDWVRMTQGEVRAVARLIERLNPVIIYDGHEDMGISNAIEFRGTVNYGVPEAVKAWDDPVTSALIAAVDPVPAGIYGTTLHEGTLINWATASGRVSVLTETRMYLSTSTRSARVSLHGMAMHEVCRFGLANADALEATTVQTQALQAREGAAGHVAYLGFTPPDLLELGVNKAFSGTVIPPCRGYFVPPNARVMAALEANRIVHHWTRRGDIYVPMGQGKAQLIATMFDPHAHRPVTAGQRVEGEVQYEAMGGRMPHFQTDGIRADTGRGIMVAGGRKSLVWDAGRRYVPPATHVPDIGERYYVGVPDKDGDNGRATGRRVQAVMVTIDEPAYMVELEVDIGSTPNQFRLLIYEDVDGTPGDIIFMTAPMSAPLTTVSVGEEIQPGDYWLAMVFNNTTTTMKGGINYGDIPVIQSDAGAWPIWGNPPPTAWIGGVNPPTLNRLIYIRLWLDPA